VKPLARLVDELRANAIASLVIGALGLLAAVVRVDRPGQIATLFVGITLIMGVLWATVGPSGHARTSAAIASERPGAATLEPPAVTVRRTLAGLAPVAIAVGALVALRPETGAILAGVPAGIAAGDLWTLAWVRRFESSCGAALLRESPPSPFSGGRRPLYTRPMKELTEET
jgi:hypothetical protein